MQKKSGAEASLLFSGLIPKIEQQLLSSLNSSLSLNNLNSVVVAAGVLAALFLAALVAAAHCSESNSYDKKHLLHVKKCF